MRLHSQRDSPFSPCYQQDCIEKAEREPREIATLKFASAAYQRGIWFCSGNMVSFIHRHLQINKYIQSRKTRAEDLESQTHTHRHILKNNQIKNGWLPLAYVEIRFPCGTAILEMTRKGAFTDKPLIYEMTIGFCGLGINAGAHRHGQSYIL